MTRGREPHIDSKAVVLREAQSTKEELDFASLGIYEKIERGPFNPAEKQVIRLLLIYKAMMGFEARTVSTLSQCRSMFQDAEPSVDTVLEKLTDDISKTSDHLSQQFRVDIQQTRAHVWGVKTTLSCIRRLAHC